MALEGTGRGELTQLVTNHILCHIDGHMLAAVVHGKGVTNEVGENCRGAALGFQDTLLASFVHRLHAFEQDRLYIRSFFNTSTHYSSPPYLLFARFTINLSLRA